MLTETGRKKWRDVHPEQYGKLMFHEPPNTVWYDKSWQDLTVAASKKLRHVQQYAEKDREGKRIGTRNGTLIKDQDRRVKHFQQFWAHSDNSWSPIFTKIATECQQHTYYPEEVDDDNMGDAEPRNERLVDMLILVYVLARDYNRYVWTVTDAAKTQKSPGYKLLWRISNCNTAFAWYTSSCFLHALSEDQHFCDDPGVRKKMGIRKDETDMKVAVIECPGPEGRSLLYRAAEAGNVARVKQLLDLGARPNTRLRTNDRTCLHAAAAGDHAAVVESLLLGGADPLLVDSMKHRPDQTSHFWGSGTVAKEIRSVLTRRQTKRERRKEDANWWLLFPLDWGDAEAGERERIKDTLLDFLIGTSFALPAWSRFKQNEMVWVLGILPGEPFKEIKAIVSVALNNGERYILRYPIGVDMDHIREWKTEEVEPITLRKTAQGAQMETQQAGELPLTESVGDTKENDVPTKDPRQPSILQFMQETNTQNRRGRKRQRDEEDDISTENYDDYEDPELDGVTTVE